MSISKVRLAATACGLLFGSAVAQAVTGTVTVYPNYGSYCSATACGSDNGSASGNTLSDGKTVVIINESYLSGNRYIGIYVAGFSSDPGAGYLRGAYCDGELYQDNAYHSYYSAQGIAYWSWTFEDPLNPFPIVGCFGDVAYPSDGPHSVTIF